jgi:hypothetical protein
LDQGQSADQELPRDEPRRGGNADLDRCDDISVGAHPAEDVEITQKAPQNSADFERLSVRKIALHELMNNEFKRPDKADFNAMELFDL